MARNGSGRKRKLFGDLNDDGKVNAGEALGAVFMPFIGMGEAAGDARQEAKRRKEKAADGARKKGKLEARALDKIEKYQPRPVQKPPSIPPVDSSETAASEVLETVDDLKVTLEEVRRKGEAAAVCAVQAGEHANAALRQSLSLATQLQLTQLVVRGMQERPLSMEFSATGADGVPHTSHLSAIDDAAIPALMIGMTSVVAELAPAATDAAAVAPTIVETVQRGFMRSSLDAIPTVGGNPAETKVNPGSVASFDKRNLVGLIIVITPLAAAVNADTAGGAPTSTQNTVFVPAADAVIHTLTAPWVAIDGNKFTLTVPATARGAVIVVHAPRLVLRNALSPAFPVAAGVLRYVEPMDAIRQAIGLGGLGIGMSYLGYGGYAFGFAPTPAT